MRHCLAHLVLLISVVWIDESASLGLDFDASADTYHLEDSLLTSDETTGWVGGDGGWNTDPEINPDLYVDASSNNECLSDADQLQMITSRHLRRRDLCPNPLFQTPPSSHDAASTKFLESIPVLTLYKYKEPDPDICPEELLEHFIYPICGFSEEEVVAGGITISPCNPCMLPFAELEEKNVRE